MFILYVKRTQKREILINKTLKVLDKQQKK